LIVLRDYQQAAIDNLRAAYAAGKRAPLLVAPTGAGKAVMLARVCHGAVDRGSRVYVMVHTVELVDQLSATLTAEGVKHGMIAAGYESNTEMGVQVCSVQTLVRRLSKTPAPDLIVTDECHHSTASGYMAIYKQWPKARLLGVTATPRRLDGRGLGSVYDAMIETPDTAALIAAGYLSPFKAFAPPTVDASGLHVRAGDFAAEEVDQLMNKAAITGDAISHYRQHADGKRAALFAHNIKAAEDYAAAFRSAGYQAFALDGRLDRTIRRQVVRDFRDGRIQVVTSCAILSEGFDLPAIECGIFLRPTASLGLWRQQVGRTLRLFDGKAHAILLDHVGNTARHGLPDDPIEWSLGDTPKKKRAGEKPPMSVRVCAKCWATAKMTARQCPECGEPFPVKERQIEQRDGELVEIQRQREKRELRQSQGRSQSLDELIGVYMKRHPEGNVATAARWAAHVMAGREKKQGAA
jgi:DNA repair protein RadD